MKTLSNYMLSQTSKKPSPLEARAQASFIVLDHIDTILDAYVLSHATKKGDVLINVYGLLQALFVSIDAMYDLAIGLTSYKYHININQNKVLHELKYVRNDVVGHPTHRTYYNQSYGFSQINYQKLTLKILSYQTYLYHPKQFEVKERSIDLHALIAAFKKEKTIFIAQLNQYLSQEKGLNVLTRLAIILYEQPTIKNLDEVKKTYQKQMNEQATHDRLTWRLELLKKAISWRVEDEEFENFVQYIVKLQAKKIVTIVSDLENVRVDLPYLSLPETLSKLFRYLNKHKDLVIYLQNLHDKDHPNFKSDLNYLLEATKRSKDTFSLFSFLNTLEDEQLVYLIGSAIKQYRK